MANLPAALASWFGTGPVRLASSLWWLLRPQNHWRLPALWLPKSTFAEKSTATMSRSLFQWPRVFLRYGHVEIFYVRLGSDSVDPVIRHPSCGARERPALAWGGGGASHVFFWGLGHQRSGEDLCGDAELSNRLLGALDAPTPLLGI